MAPNRITWGGVTPRGLAPALLAIALGVAALLLAGCGGGSSSTTATTATTPATTGAPAAESPDAPILNTILTRQEAAVQAYEATIPKLPPRFARMAGYFRAQEQEHVDALIKAMRGLGITPEPKAESIDLGEPRTETERLVFLYEVEGATIDEELSAISKLEASWPRSLLASTVANQAQHLTLLRGALGAGPLASVPVPFEDGTQPPPTG